MTQEEFRSLHSQIIEKYQWIEFNFKRILSLLMNKDLGIGLYELDGVAWGHLVASIRTAEHEKETAFISDAFYAEFDAARKERNYWCHQCYLDIGYDEDANKALRVKPRELVDRLLNDSRSARELQEQIQGIYYDVLHDYLKREQPKI